MDKTSAYPAYPTGDSQRGHGSLRPVRVWDVPTRLFHWALVGLVGYLWWTGENGPMEYHMLTGYAVLALILWRLMYGLIGSTTARFTDFVKGPSAVIGYLKTAFGKGGNAGAKRYVLGHNPAGGWMVVLLLLLVLSQAGTACSPTTTFSARDRWPTW